MQENSEPVELNGVVLRIYRPLFNPKLLQLLAFLSLIHVRLRSFIPEQMRDWTGIHRIKSFISHIWI
jgi:hypothetical protein